MTSFISQTDLLCPSCGGQCLFDPATAQLRCISCGTHHPIDNTPSPDELPYDPDIADEEQPSHNNAQIHHCQTCGGDILFTGHILTENCPYCDGAVVRGTEKHAYGTMALIPFTIGKAEARKSAQTWVRRRFAAPNGLDDQVSQARLAGLYAPFWTFDSREAIEYWAKYRVRQGKRTRIRRVQGKMTTIFDDLIVPASPHVTPLIRDGILHEFHPNKLRPFSPSYLAGFSAERHHQTLIQGFQNARREKNLLIRNRIRHHIGKTGVHDIGYHTDTSGIHYRRILLPVWIIHYRYNGKNYKIVVSGIDGRCFGERPFSKWKLFGYSATLTAATMIFGAIWGAAGLL